MLPGRLPDPAENLANFSSDTIGVKDTFFP